MTSHIEGITLDTKTKKKKTFTLIKKKLKMHGKYIAAKLIHS